MDPVFSNTDDRDIPLQTKTVSSTTLPVMKHFGDMDLKSEATPAPVAASTTPLKKAAAAGASATSPVSSGGAALTPSSGESVKMVLKNGVLVKKQKQRRYRTERPFGCDHCTARFTLRYLHFHLPLATCRWPPG